MTNTSNLQNLVGRFFVASWGYDQTNVDFYKVVKASAKSVYVTKVKTIKERIDSFNYSAVPSDEHDDIFVRCKGEKEVMRKTVKDYGAGALLTIKLDYTVARLWHGEPVFGSSEY